MSIKKTIRFTTGSVTLPPTSSAHILPIGEQPEGNLDALGKLEAAIKSLLSNIDKLGENIKKLKAENQKLKDALGIVETTEPLILMPDMEVKDGHK